MERETKIEVGEKYRHFKGGIYEIVAVARDCEDPKKEFVVYKMLYKSPKYPVGTVWAREKNNFLEEITRDGKTLWRFEEIV